MEVNKISKSKYNLSPTERRRCHEIIHSASGSAGVVGAGLAQLPLTDSVLITPIQITMIVSLGKVFEQEITKTAAKALLGSIATGFVGRGAAQVALGWVPGVGNVSNAIIASAITETLGWLCVDYFYKERYLSDSVTNENTEFMQKNESTEKCLEKTNKQKELVRRVEEFIDEEKTRICNKEEYVELLEDFEKAYNEGEVDDEVRESYDKFLKVR